MCDERIFWDYGHKEINSCAGTGLNPCIFFFKDNCLNYLKINTIGEEYPEQDIYAIVSDVIIFNEDEFDDFRESIYLR